MRIAKATLMTRWGWSTALAVGAFAILSVLDLRLKALTGVGTADLASFDSPLQVRAAFLDPTRGRERKDRAAFNRSNRPELVLYNRSKPRINLENHRFCPLIVRLPSPSAREEPTRRP